MGEKDEENKVRRGDGDSRVEVDHDGASAFLSVQAKNKTKLMGR